MTVPSTHVRFASPAYGTNIVNNGAFTQYRSNVKVLPNTGPMRSSIAKDKVNVDLYAQGVYGFTTPAKGLLGFWDFSGAAAQCVVNPSVDGVPYVSRDGGNVLKVAISQDGSVFLDQVIVDLKRFQNVVIGFAFSGIHIVGNMVVKAGFIINGEFVEGISASSLTFGDYRRITGSVQTEKVESLVFRLEIQGCVGDELGLSGICVKLGETSPPLSFISSLVDRALPSGVTFMFEGDTCPPGYEEVEDGRMALVSGTKAFQEVKGADVTMLGSDTHDHSPNTNGLDTAEDGSVVTETPLKARETAIIRSVPYNQYPNSVPFQPYPGERPISVLGINHSHRLRTAMTCVPPTFPIKFCRKL